MSDSWLVRQLSEKRDSALAEARKITDRAEAEKRELTAQEVVQFDALAADMDSIRAQGDSFRKLDAQIKEQEKYLTHALGGGNRAASTAREWSRRSDGRSATADPGQRLAENAVVADMLSQQDRSARPVVEQHGTLDNFVRSLSTTSGSAIVPTIWGTDIIDRARNYAAVLQAGAQIVPMDAQTIQIGRLTTDPTAAFRSEGTLITASDPVFDNVTLQAKTLTCQVTGSLEWFMDAINVEETVSNAIAKAVALELDFNALYGGVVAGSEVSATGFNRVLTSPPSPRGVLAALLAVAPGNVLGGAANGTTQTATRPWDEILDLVYTPADSNEQVNGLIWSSKMQRRYAKLYDTLSQPLRVPDALANIPRYVSNQVPSNMTVGTSTTNMTDVFAADWTQLLIGQRLDFHIQTLTERYAELGQISIIATWRGDIAPARPKAFSVYRYLQNT
ncbi:phage major capsid protein [Nakamurella sp. PAMC28650]|uniref:phage major capsid protein n=1 Tax=Nakamurella sp. PAMC28650 TaxID=2762325 RepID=UPI00164DE809|nr:phage major capsid protein [Nakamurella sp. PAMC28650]QNK79313.1 phage major capsid protein [Nakamurella sp. PAMC28650]